jgi:hypothetical protein
VKRFVIVVGSVGVTAGVLAIAMTLGSMSFEYRQASFHQGRLQRLVEKEPSVELVSTALNEEGTQLVGSAAGEAELRTLCEEWTGGVPDEALASIAKWPTARAFLTGDFVYILYFDEAGITRDFSLHQRPPQE